MIRPYQTKDPKKCKPANKTPHQCIQMPVDDCVAQKTIDEGIDNAHEWAIGRKQWDHALCTACLTRPQDVPVVMIVSKFGDTNSVCNHGCKENEQNGNEGFAPE